MIYFDRIGSCAVLAALDFCNHAWCSMTPWPRRALLQRSGYTAEFRVLPSLRALHVSCSVSRGMHGLPMLPDPFLSAIIGSLTRMHVCSTCGIVCRAQRL